MFWVNLNNLAFTDKFNKTTHLILKANFTEKHDEKEISYAEIRAEEVKADEAKDKTIFIEQNNVRELESKKKESMLINTID
jgi:hypothetical protein